MFLSLCSLVTPMDDDTVNPCVCILESGLGICNPNNDFTNQDGTLTATNMHLYSDF